MRTTLEEKIAEAHAKHEKEMREEQYENMVKDFGSSTIEKVYFLRGTYNENRLLVEAKTAEIFAQLLDALPVTAERFFDNYKGRHLDYQIECPFQLTLTSSSREPVMFSINWQHNDMTVDFRVPARQIEPFVRFYLRKVSDTEFIHYTGMSRQEIGQCRIAAAHFTYQNQKHYYKGFKVLLDVNGINAIVEYLKQYNEREDV